MCACVCVRVRVRVRVRVHVRLHAVRVCAVRLCSVPMQCNRWCRLAVCPDAGNIILTCGVDPTPAPLLASDSVSSDLFGRVLQE